MQVITEIDGDTAEVHPLDGRDREKLATKLLTAAGDRRREVKTYTGRTGAGFRVPMDIAEAAGLVPTFAEGGIVEPVQDEQPDGVEPEGNSSEIPNSSNDPEIADSSEAGDDSPETAEADEQTAAPAAEQAEPAENSPAVPAEATPAPAKPARKTASRTKAKPAEEKDAAEPGEQA